MEKGTLADNLIVFGMNKDFIKGTPEGREFILRVTEKVKTYKETGKKVYYARDAKDAGCAETNGCKYIDRDAYGTIEWWDWFLGNVELAGVYTDTGIVSAAIVLKTAFPEYEVTVDAGCCAGTTPEMHKAALAVMRSCKINVVGN